MNKKRRVVTFLKRMFSELPLKAQFRIPTDDLPNQQSPYKRKHSSTLYFDGKSATKLLPGWEDFEVIHRIIRYE